MQDLRPSAESTEEADAGHEGPLQELRRHQVENDTMSLGIEDGFNFAMGEWLAEVTRLLIGGGIVLMIAGVIFGGICIYEWWCDRRMKE